MLRTSAAGMTMMAGPSEAMAVEQRLLAALGAGGVIEIDGAVLRIGSGGEQLVLRVLDGDSPDTVGGGGGGGAGEGAVTGRVFYRERIAMPPGAVLTVSLLDVSRADAVADVLARIDVPDPGNVPVEFELPFDRSLIDDRHTYAVRATIEVDGRLAWTTDTVHAVITGGRPSDIDVLLVSARS